MPRGGGRRILFHLLIFVAGFLLAIVFSLRHRILSSWSETRLFSSPPAMAVSSVPRTVKPAAEVPALQPPPPVERQPSEPDIKAMRAALAAGTYESFQALRSDALALLPDYHSTVLPQLKPAALNEFLRRFNDRDWREWPVSFDKKTKIFSTARLYVDDLRLANPELARYLETAGLLLHGLYQSMRSGRPYNASAELYYALQNAEQIFAGRTVSAVPARTLLDAEIVNDKSFQEKLEGYRGELAAGYYARYPDQLETGLKLFLQLQPVQCSRRVLTSFGRLLLDLSLRTTPKYRENAANMLIKATTTTEFLKAEPALGEPLAQFYLLTALDALQRSDRERARGLLELSSAAKPGLKEQATLRAALDKPVRAPEAVAQKPEAPKEEKAKNWLDLGSTKPEESSGSGYQSILVAIVLVLALLFVGGRFMLALLSKRAVVMLPKEYGHAEPFSEEEFQQPVLTSPSELGFDEDLLAMNKS